MKNEDIYKFDTKKSCRRKMKTLEKKIQLRSNCFQFCHIYCSCNKYTYYCFFKNLLYSKFLFVSKNVIGCLRLRAPSLIVRPTNCLYFPNFWLSNLICRVLELLCKNPIKIKINKKNPCPTFLHGAWIHSIAMCGCGCGSSKSSNI